LPVQPESSARSGRSLSAGESSSTPTVAQAIANSAAMLTRSPSATKANSATCTTSVFE
jgi:hypothetical protein